MPWSGARARSRRSPTRAPSSGGWARSSAGTAGVDVAGQQRRGDRREVGLLESDPDQWWRDHRGQPPGPLPDDPRRAAALVAAAPGRVAQPQLGRRLPQRRHRHGIQRLQGRAGPAHVATARHQPRRPRVRPRSRRGAHRHDRARWTPTRDRTEWTDPAEVADLALALARRRARRVDGPAGARRGRHPGVAGRASRGRGWPRATAR